MHDDEGWTLWTKVKITLSAGCSKTEKLCTKTEKNLLRLALAILWVTAAARRYIVTYSDGVVAGKLS